MELIDKTDRDTFEGPIHSRGSRNPQTSSLVNSHLLEDTIKKTHKRAEEIMIFPGCLVEFKEIKKIQKFLKDNGTDTLIVQEGICCGLPYLLQGNVKEALRCMKQNVKIFHQIKTKRIYTPCPFCLKMFTTYYPLYLNQRIRVEFNHICNFFSSLEIKSIWNFSKKVAYHSPCLLDQKTASNHQQVIKKLAGGSYVSIPAQICCGHGVQLPYINEELSKTISQSNLARIIEKGVQVLITDCPSCTTNWIEGIKEKDLDLEVIPFWDLVVRYSKFIKSRFCSL
jgi:Fe-S oxidoreductase